MHEVLEDIDHDETVQFCEFTILKNVIEPLNLNPCLYSETTAVGMAMSRFRNLFVMCSVLMGSLFAYSASVQLNDPGNFSKIDWYVWLPLYSCACIVHLTNSIISTKLNRQIAKLALWLGMFLFVKVVVEDLVNGISGFLSMDLSERVVREKTGSLLVIISMILQLGQSSAPNESSRLVNYGMVLLVFFCCIPSLLFFVVQRREMKF